MSWSDLGDVVIEPSIYAADFSRLSGSPALRHCIGAGALGLPLRRRRLARTRKITIGPVVVLASISPLRSRVGRELLTAT